MRRVARCTSQGANQVLPTSIRSGRSWATIRPLVGTEPAARPRGQHEAIGLLRGNRRAVQTIAANAARLEDLVTGAGHHDNLAERRPALDVAGFLEEIGPDAARRLAEELGD